MGLVNYAAPVDQLLQRKVKEKATDATIDTKNNNL